jgi:hypothetical protein
VLDCEASSPRFEWNGRRVASKRDVEDLAGVRRPVNEPTEARITAGPFRGTKNEVTVTWRTRKKTRAARIADLPRETRGDDRWVFLRMDLLIVILQGDANANAKNVAQFETRTNSISRMQINFPKSESRTTKAC